MLYHEKQNYVNIFSGILITALYSLIVFRKYLSGGIDITGDHRVWGYLLLIFIGISIVARIVIQIIFHVINVIATREQDVPKKDERDKMIGLKAIRNAYYTFSGVFFTTLFMVTVFGLPVYVIYIAFIAGGLVTEIVENASQIYYYRKNG